MSLTSASTDILRQLTEVVGQFTNVDYARPVDMLSGNTIGKHVRHIIEFYELLLNSTQTGWLNYDHRQRDLLLEIDTDEALRRISRIDRAVNRVDLTQPLTLETDLSTVGVGSVLIPSSLARELLYNVEHAIHHMALIQVAVKNVFPFVVLPAHFGVAYSTVQHQSH